MSFMALPPEINSARMHTGPGAGPMIAAASGWSAMSEQVTSAAAGIYATLSSLTASWLGPSADKMLNAGTIYVSWLTTLAEQTSETAGQALAAVAAYEAAFAATVPPPAIAANRALLSALVATNFLGVNTAAIAATEALYMEMWAQDAAAMFEYHAASAQAAMLPRFMPPSALVSHVPAASIAKGLGLNIFKPGSNQETRGLAGLLNLWSGQSQSAFGGFLNANQFTSGYYYSVPIQGLQGLSQFVGLGSLGQGQQQIDIAQANSPNNTWPIPQPTPQEWPIPQPTPSPSGALGAARSVGNLSVPQSWARSVPGAFSNPEPIAALNADRAPFMGVPGVPFLGGAREKGEPARYGFPAKLLQRHTAGG